MARVTHVKKAQQRYKMVPVIDPETGEQATRIMKRARPTKRGATESVVRVTREDRDQPLPPYECGSCHKPIEVGTPYKWIQPKSGPYGGRRMNRHEACPTWNVWDYSDSLSANTARIAYEFTQELEGFESPEDVTSALESAADQIQELADAKREGAENIVEGFGHETYQSEELSSVADELEGWAEEVRSVDVPELPEPEEEDCEACSGSGKDTCETCNGSGVADEDSGDEDECADCNGTGQADCETCEGSGTFTPEEPTEEQMDEWRSEVEDAVAIVDECPV